MGAKLRVVEHNGWGPDFRFYCPGCESWHEVWTTIGLRHKDAATWGYNGNIDCPTFDPSILVSWDVGPEHKDRRCHMFVREGIIEYLGDCTHELAGERVIMGDVNLYNDGKD